MNCASHDVHFQLYEQSKQAMRASFGHMERPDTHDTRPTVEKVLQVTKSYSLSVIFSDLIYSLIALFMYGLLFDPKKFN